MADISIVGQTFKCKRQKERDKQKDARRKTGYNEGRNTKTMRWK